MTDLSNTLIAQMYGQESDDPFLTLMTLTHDNFDTIRFVNNSVDITSNGNVYEAFPFQITLPADDGEAIKDINITIDNVALELIDELRSITDYIYVKLELVIASNPDLVEVEIAELKIVSIEYNSTTITATLAMDNFLGTDLSNEKYTPSNYPGLFT